MSRINLIKNARDNFNNLCALAQAMLILGQLFILILLLGSLAYIIFGLYISGGATDIVHLMLVGTLARESAVITLGIVWAGSLLIDCADKERRSR